MTLREIVDGVDERPSRGGGGCGADRLCPRDGARARRASEPGFLKKFYGWYLRRGGFPRPFVQELVRLETTDEVVERLLIAEPGAAAAVARIEVDMPDTDGTLVPPPISASAAGLS